MTMLEKANAAAMAEVRRQLGLKPIPGDVGGGWAGVGDPGSLDFAPIVRAVLEAIGELDQAFVDKHLDQFEEGDTAAFSFVVRLILKEQADG